MLIPSFCSSMFQVRHVVPGGNHSFPVGRSDQIAFGDPGTSPGCNLAAEGKWESSVLLLIFRMLWTVVKAVSFSRY